MDAWKTQYTMPKNSIGHVVNHNINPGSRSATPSRSRSGSFAGSDDMMFEETASQRSGGSKSPSFSYNDAPGTPRGYLSSYGNSSNNNSNNNAVITTNQQHQQHHVTPSCTDFGAIDSGSGGDPNWIEISRDPIYVPTTDDVGHKLKIEAAAYSLETGELLMTRVIKTDVVLGRSPDPEPRTFITASAANKGSGQRFRVVTYNLLAEIYATQQQYPSTDFWALSWEYRFGNLLREIEMANPDVICLQEIQADHYENHVYAQMSDAGYEGVYKQKTRQSMGLAGKVDGCALFWRRSKFHLVESYSIEFNEVAQRQATQVLGLNPRSEEGMQFLNRLSKDNVAQLVVLEFIHQPVRSRQMDINQVCIANTHLYSNKDFPDVKLWQAWQLLQELESFIMSRGTNLPLIICGDFNSTPDTAVYHLMSSQTVNPAHPDVNVARNDDVPNVLPDPMNITHSFQLGSAYNTIQGEEPWVTNYTHNFKGVLDYIWYSASNLRPVAVAPVPDKEVLTKHGDGLPSTALSSDHIMLIADMQVIGNSR
jgi:CCR4-NOT transcription complex subunit 6